MRWQGMAREIYGGTYPNGNLLKWNGSNAWEQVAPKYGSETYILSLIVFPPLKGRPAPMGEGLAGTGQIARGLAR